LLCLAGICGVEGKDYTWEDDGKEPLACSTPIEQQLAGQLFELSDQPQNGTKRVPG
jgi:hypothetical protein